MFQSVFAMYDATAIKRCPLPGNLCLVNEVLLENNL